MNKELEVVKNDLTVSKLGAIFTKSGLFRDSRDQSQAIVKILAGGEMGLGSVASMVSLDIIKGSLRMSANLQAAFIKRSAQYDYRVREKSPTICKIEFFQWENSEKESIGIQSFSMEDAKRAGLSGDNWRKYPEAMLFNRCISAGVKAFTPDIFFGMTAYAEGEVPGEGVETTEEQVEVVQQAVEEAVEEVPDTIDVTAPPEGELTKILDVMKEVILTEDMPEEGSSNDNPYYRFLRVCQEHKKRIGNRVYYRTLNMHGLAKSNEIGPNNHKLMNTIVGKFSAIHDPPDATWFVIAHSSLLAEYTDREEHRKDGLYLQICKRYDIHRPDDAHKVDVLPLLQREEFIEVLEDALHLLGA